MAVWNSMFAISIGVLCFFANMFVSYQYFYNPIKLVNGIKNTATFPLTCHSQVNNCHGLSWDCKFWYSAVSAQKSPSLRT
jgi:hypothetical protein